MAEEEKQVEVKKKLPQRCLVNLFGYCVGEPDYAEMPIEKKVLDPKTGTTTDEVYLIGGKCKLIPSNCGMYSTLTQETKGIPHYTGSLKEKKDFTTGKKGRKKQAGLQTRMFD